MQVECSKCLQLIALSDIVDSSGGRMSHVNCARPRTLTMDERTLLFVYCTDHVVAQCLSCGLSLRLAELAADPLGGGRAYQCPRCRKGLTENVRTHLYGCPMLPSEVRRRAQEVRETAQRLVKESQDRVQAVGESTERLVKQSRQLLDSSDVRIREAETALFESQRSLREAMSKRTPQMPDDPLLREKAREAIQSGKLPPRAADRVVDRRGWSGLSCRVCGEPVKRDELEVEIQFGRADPTLGLDAYQLHPQCFAAWEFERANVEESSR